MVAGIAVLCAYAFASWRHVRALDAASRSVARRLSTAVAGLHAGYLVLLAWTGVLPSYAASWSALGFGVMVAALGLSVGRLVTLSRWLVPVAMGLHAVGLVLPTARVSALQQLGASAWLPVHLALVWAALAGFVAEFCVTMVEGVVRRRLKAKRLEGLDAFPALDALARVRLRALGFGVVSLALGVLAGAVWASGGLPHGDWLADPKVAWTLAVWLWYMVAFFVHRSREGHARYAPVWSGVGLGGVLILFVGLDFLVPGFHAYGG